MAITQLVRLIVDFKDRFSRPARDLNKEFSNLNNQTGRFRMEMLGILFFGMGISNFFKGLLDPILNATGAFELWNAILKVLYLDTGVGITEFLADLLGKVSNLDDSTKELAGQLTLAGIAFGTLTFLIGMFVLGIEAWIKAWSTIKMIGMVGLISSLSVAFVVLGGHIASTKFKTTDFGKEVEKLRDNLGKTSGFKGDLVSASIFLLIKNQIETAMEKLEDLSFKIRGFRSLSSFQRISGTGPTMFDELFPPIPKPGFQSQSHIPEGSSILAPTRPVTINNDINLSVGEGFNTSASGQFFDSVFSEFFYREASERIGKGIWDSLERESRGRGS